MNERILIWGAGAIGGVLGAVLSVKGVDVTFVDVDRMHVEAIRTRGLHVRGPVRNVVAKAPAFHPDELEGRWDCVLLAVKAQHTAEACGALVAHLSDDGYVASFQNGLCEETIAEVVGSPRTIGAFVNFYADWLEPGEVHFSNYGTIAVGELDGSLTPRLRNLHRMLQLFDSDAILTQRISSYLWSKLAYASFLFAQATGEMGIADSLDRDELLPLWRSLAGEVLAVACAEGIVPLPFNGFDPAAYFPGATESAARRNVQELVAFNRHNTKTHSGIWRDLAIHKRKTEIDLQLAPVIAIGRKHEIACPSLEALVDTIRAIETGRRIQCDDNLIGLMNDGVKPQR